MRLRSAVQCFCVFWVGTSVFKRTCDKTGLHVFCKASFYGEVDCITTTNKDNYGRLSRAAAGSALTNNVIPLKIIGYHSTLYMNSYVESQ